MSRAASTDRKATAAEVRAHAPEARRIAHELGLPAPRLRADGTVVITSTSPGYADAIRLSARLTDLVEAYVHVITDDAPAAAPASAL